jgi:hypothetical protein
LQASQLRQFLQALFRRLPSHWGLLQPLHAVCRPASTIVRSIRASWGLTARAISARILPKLWSLDSKDWKRLTSRWLRLKSLAILVLSLFLARIELPFANYLAAALQHFPSEKAIHLKIDGGSPSSSGVAKLLTLVFCTVPHFPRGRRVGNTQTLVLVSQTGALLVAFMNRA